MQTFLDTIKTNTFWVRLVLMVIYAIILDIALSLLLLLILVQWVYRLFAGEVQAGLYGFNASLKNFLLDIMNYLLYQTEQRPFPFSDWPDAGTEPRPTYAEYTVVDDN